ncbi:SDR family oxidoreductase [Nocardioides sp. MAH-18]|uniref:SDR family oxidoreductase n=1 Tax=Nocardioides agri TaxID=2682843 RepID=A0A6L6XMY6_9ACTN|nr:MULTISPECIES: SDR family NAD(P)-dependent oxidoreductase [unclassified Nocardioides]MBA2953224.1 SDR family oxidoreductase [Nocardioides sp. CGMCC 1.13656]MVQ48093.1 SDR family oxidoreductase [Nocardioides sp. MAH-18]
MTKTALVTGAARGIGRQIAVSLAKEGYAVAVVDTDLDGYREFEEAECSVVDELEGYGVPTIAVEASTTDVAAMTALGARITAEWSGLDALVCNAGGGSGGFDENNAADIDLAALDTVLQRNLHGTIVTVQAALPALRRSTSATIVTMGSVTGVVANPRGTYAHYGITKAAVMHYTRCLANDLAPEGIRVNCIAPGLIATGRARKRLSEQPDRESSVLDRIGTPEEVAEAVRFLVSPAASHMSGQVLQLWQPDVHPA